MQDEWNEWSCRADSPGRTPPRQDVVATVDAVDPVRTMLLGDAGDGIALPGPVELVTALMSLADGTRRKVLLPLPGAPLELSLVRRSDRVEASCYETGSVPEVHVLDRSVPLRALLDACIARARARMPATARATRDHIARKLVDRAARADILPVDEMDAVERTGGSVEEPDGDVPLAFGFSAAFTVHGAPPADRALRADVHALLFPGTLWAWVRGHRLVITRGPVLLTVQRMLAAVRALIDAWEGGRAANVRLRSGPFHIGVRLHRSGEVALTLGCDGEGVVTATALDVPHAALPVLRLGADLLRALVAADRAQSRNLRVRALRDEVRTLRRLVRTREGVGGFVNRDPDRLRAAVVSDPPAPSAREQDHAPIAAATATTASLRFSERWRVEVDGLDAAAAFFCGDRLVVSTPREAFALGREQGEVLWAREGAGAACMMAGTVLLRALPDGRLELCDVADGEAFATTRLAPRVGPLTGVHAGGGAIPPTAVLVEGTGRLVAIDLRTGEPRWRWAARGTGAVRLCRAGPVLLVASGDGALNALDVATGELAWRFSDRTRFSLAPAVCRDMVVAASGEPGGRAGTLYGIDLYSGKLAWRRALDAAPAAPPIAAGALAATAFDGGRRGSLAAFDPEDGELVFMVPDPGVSAGGACLPVDDLLIVNAPAGRLSALDLASGTTRWQRRLADPIADDVPRRLEPVLRGGALFVPAAQVHIIRPADGASIGGALPCDLVPDLVRVDERGWVYIAEESGHIAAYAPVPHLSLIRGGG